MKKQRAFSSWPRFLLWAHVLGVIGFYITLWFRTTPKCEERARRSTPTEPTVRKSISIIVPARNEERDIRRSITSLLEQDYDDYEVIVVDDDSTDGTADILEDIAQSHPQGERMWVLRLRELPEGWAGKPHALHRGVQEARGNWLLFTDADTWHTPHALRFAMALASNEGIDLLSLSTGQELPGFWDKVKMPMAYTGISMQYPIKLVNDPASPVALANGQYILMRRSVYDIVGGYARPDLCNTLLDDRDLANVVKTCGFRLRLEDGRDLVHTRMYEGLNEIWRGWRKNAFLGSRGGLAFTLLMLIGLPMVAIVPFLLPLLGWLGRARRTRDITSSEVSIATLLELVPLLAYRVWVNRECRVPWYYAFTYPLASALFEGILAQSAWRVL